MSEERFRRAIRRGFEPLLGRVPSGPGFDELTRAAAAGTTRVRPTGWRAALVAATAVIAIGTLALVLSPTGPAFDARASALVGEQWWEALFEGDTGTLESLTHPDSDLDPNRLEESIASLGSPLEVTMGADTFGTETLPQLCYILTGPAGEQAGSVVFQAHESDWLVREIRTGVVACGGQVPVTTTAPGPTTTTPPSETACVPGGPPKAGIDLQNEAILSAYNRGGASDLVAIIGDGQVYDPTLQPEGEAEYPNVADWLAAAERVGDTLGGGGYGMGEPFQLFVERSNPTLRSRGIERVAITLQFWANQDCEWRVEATEQVVAVPEACLFHEVFPEARVSPACDGPFEPRSGHVAVWTGTEVVIYGGIGGTHDESPLVTGLAYNPSTGTWRDLAPSPVPVQLWRRETAAWTGSEMLVAGRVNIEGVLTVAVLAYSPSSNSWRLSSPHPTHPDERYAIGAAVWTGLELLLIGGDINAPDDSAWAYDPNTDAWRALPDGGIPEIEETQGVWTGTEALVIGGYAFQEPTAYAAYRPQTDSWRQLPDSGEHWFEGHRLAWTGEHVIVYSGHSGPSHRDTLLIFDPATDQWHTSLPMPIPARERLAGTWTGEHLMIWGGYGTYGETASEAGDYLFGDGAMYHPRTDTWTILPPAPLAARCDHSGTWTGEEFVVFGGMLECGQPHVIADGHAASYNPASNEWTLLTR